MVQSQQPKKTILSVLTDSKRYYVKLVMLFSILSLVLSCSSEKHSKEGYTVTFLNKKQTLTINTLIGQHLNDLRFEYDSLGDFFAINDSSKSTVYVIEDYNEYDTTGNIHLLYFTDHIEQFVSFNLSKDRYERRGDSVFYNSNPTHEENFEELWSHTDSNYCQNSISKNFSSIIYFSKINANGFLETKSFVDLRYCVNRNAGENIGVTMPRNVYFSLLSLTSYISLLNGMDGVSMPLENQKNRPTCVDKL